MADLPGCCVDHRYAAREAGRVPLPIYCDGNAEPKCMRLPDGKTCADCAHLSRCVALFGVRATNTTCDFHPRRFRQVVHG